MGARCVLLCGLGDGPGLGAELSPLLGRVRERDDGAPRADARAVGGEDGDADGDGEVRGAVDGEEADGARVDPPRVLLPRRVGVKGGCKGMLCGWVRACVCACVGAKGKTLLIAVLEA